MRWRPTVALAALLAAGAGARPSDNVRVFSAVRDEAKATALFERYLALTRGWAKEATFTRAERAAMENGRRSEDAMWKGLDDPLARKVMAAGEPSVEALEAIYPPKVLDRTVLGSYSDPRVKPAGSQNEFVLWWNGAVGAHLIDGQLRGAPRQLACNTNVLFRVGPDADMFGRDGERFTRIGYLEGWLPIVQARYEHGGIRYEQTAFAAPDPRPGIPEDVCHVRFTMTNTAASRQQAEIAADLILIDGTEVRAAEGTLVDERRATLLVSSERGARFDAATQRMSHMVALEPGTSATVSFAIPYLPEAGAAPLQTTPADFDAELDKNIRFWKNLLASGMRIDVPEPRVDRVWRALLLQNFVLADGPRFTYGAGLWYNASYFPVENGMGTHDFAAYGFAEYAHALMPMAIDVSIFKERAGRKYQNRRGLALHHLFEHYRLTKTTDLFERYRADLFRVADEIVADRRSTMVEENGRRPLHWGLLPKDRPGADDLGGTYTMHVVAHNITSCQGLEDFGHFLVRTGADRARGERYLAEAREYRKTILEAMERSTIRSKGRPPFVPLETLYFSETPDYGPEPYDDLNRSRRHGSYYHFWADIQLGLNFLDPDDRVARWITDYLDKMGGFVLGCTQSFGRRAPQYGWINNVYNSGYYDFMLRSGEIDKFLLGFYARLQYGMTRHALVGSEGSPLIRYNTVQGGFVDADHTFPNSAANSETLRMLRTMLVHEEIADNVETGDIWIARGAPRSWLAAGKAIKAAGAVTYFGPLSFSIESQAAEGRITAHVQPPTREPYRAIVLSLRHPEKLPLRRVRVNGREHAGFDPARETVRLERGPAEFRVEAFYR